MSESDAFPRVVSVASSTTSVVSEKEPTAAELATADLLESLSADEAVDSLGALVKLAANPVSAADMLGAGAASAVTLTMRTFPLASVQYRALSALRAFSVAPALRSEVLREGGLELTLTLMNSDRSLTVQDRGATIIANLAVGCAHRKRRLAREGAMTAVVRAMAAFPADVQMQVRGALALRNLCHNAQVNQYIAGKAGAVDIVLDALLALAQVDDKDLVYQTVAALETMCTQDKSNRARVVQRDALAWEHSAWPAQALATEDGNLSPVSSTSDANHKMLLPDATSHAKQAPPQNALSSRLPHFDYPLHDSDDADGTPSTDPKSSLSMEAAPQKPHSVYKLVLRAIRKAPENRSLLKYSLSLLALTAWKQPSVQSRLGELGAVEIALATVKRYVLDVPLVSRACTLVCTLCLQEENRSRVHSGLGVLLRALEANIDNLPATREISSAISNALYNSPRNRASVIDRHGGRIVADMLVKNDGRDLKSMEAGLCTLRNLVDGQRDGAATCASENAITAARTALDATKNVSTDDEKRVQVQAILLLADIAKSETSTLPEMRNLEVADWVENALAKLDKHVYSDAHYAGDELLSSLHERIDFVRSADQEYDDTHSFSFSSRWAQTKEMFQSISVPFNPTNKRTTDPGKRRRRRRRFWGRRSEPRASGSSRNAEVFFGRRWPWSS